MKRNVEKVWGARYILGARYLSKNTVFFFYVLLTLHLGTISVTDQLNAQILVSYSSTCF